MSSILIEGMYGLGDNIYQRPFIRSALAIYSRVFLKTAWPQLYADMPLLHFVNPETGLRTQAKNVAAWPGVWEHPRQAPRIRLSYGVVELKTMGIVESLRKRATWHGEYPLVWDAPKFDVAVRQGPRYAIVRPVTVRQEWKSQARGCDPAYVQHAIYALKDRGYRVVSLADVDGAAERFVGDPPRGADVEYHHGELRVDQIIELVRKAAVCVGGVGWLAPMCFAIGTPLFLIYGGRGAHNAPEVITHATMGLRHVEHVLPDNFCRCDQPEHDCDKRISNFERRFEEFLTKIEMKHGPALG